MRDVAIQGGLYMAGAVSAVAASQSRNWFRFLRDQRRMRQNRRDGLEVTRILEGLGEQVQVSSHRIAASPLVQNPQWRDHGSKEGSRQALLRRLLLRVKGYFEVLEVRTPEQVAMTAYVEQVGETYRGRHRVEDHNPTRAWHLNTSTREFDSLRLIRTDPNLSVPLEVTDESDKVVFCGLLVPSAREVGVSDQEAGQKGGKYPARAPQCVPV